MARLLFALVLIVPTLIFLGAIGITVWLVVRGVLRRDARRAARPDASDS